ncbi:MAG: ABC transporter permease [Deltaproteobacteria bacterium]|nr:MAG: ABC transporter permease [Deltaproteobacteria bacterium]
MRYEYQIGWRYLNRGTRSRATAVGAAVSFAVMVAACGYFFAVEPSGWAIVGIAVGGLAATTFGLLHVLSVFTTVATLGVVLGVAALTVVMSVTSGFERSFRDKVLGVTAHILVRKATNDFSDYEQKRQLALGIDPDVITAQPIVYTEMLITRGKGKLAGVAIKGIIPGGGDAVASHMLEGSEAALGVRPAEGEPPPILIGRDLAEKIDARYGDVVTVVAPMSNVDTRRWTPTGRPPRTKKFRVAGIFYVGFDEYDQRLAYMSLKDAQDLVGYGDVVLGIELRIKDVHRAREIADKLDAALGGPPYQVEDWRELNGNLFAALSLQKLAMGVVLTLIIAVAAFNLVSALTMMVTDKIREIAILKSMGAQSSSIARIFRTIGLLIGGVGTACGLAIGIALCLALSRYEYALDPNVYRIDRLPVDLRPLEVAFIAAMTLAISAVATVVPARRAAAMHPVDGLRYD